MKTKKKTQTQTKPTTPRYHHATPLPSQKNPKTLRFLPFHAAVCFLHCRAAFGGKPIPWPRNQSPGFVLIIYHSCLIINSKTFYRLFPVQKISTNLQSPQTQYLWSDQQLGWQAESKFHRCKALYPWNPQYRSTAIYNTLLQPSLCMPYIICCISYHCRSPAPQDRMSSGKLQTGKTVRIIKKYKEGKRASQACYSSCIIP